MIELTAKKYYGKRCVLDVENLKFDDLKTYAIIGANGSGKSTLLRVIAKFIQADGQRLVDKNLKIGVMPQNNYAFSLSVLHNIILGCSLIHYNDCKARALLLIDKLNLTELKNKNAAKLSGGETQRVALARLLMIHNDILLLDEPSASMDIHSAQIMEKTLMEYRAEHNCTIIFATHSIAQARRLADVIMFFHNGKLIEFGSPKELFDNPKTDEVKSFLDLS
ncbi:MAG: ATP-binding cassette domain-containing protein [Clostridia bacterium]